MNHPQTHSRKRDWTAIFIAIALGAGLTSSVSAAPLHRTYYGRLYIGLFESDSRTYCPGDDVKFTVRAGVESRAAILPSSGIQIQVNGSTKAETENGYATWTEPAPKKPGKVEITAIAVTPNTGEYKFIPSPPRTISYTVMECAYDFQIQYDESYSVPLGEGTFTEIATLTVQDSFSISEDGTLKPKSGGSSLTGKYVMKGFFSLGKNVVVCMPNSGTLSGPFEIGFSGERKSDGSATLRLSQYSLSTGMIVNWECGKDPNGRIIHYKSAAMPDVNLINRAKLNSLSFTRNEGRKPITVSEGGVFWAIEEIKREGWVALTLVQTEPKSDWFDW